MHNLRLFKRKIKDLTEIELFVIIFILHDFFQSRYSSFHAPTQGRKIWLNWSD